MNAVCRDVPSTLSFGAGYALGALLASRSIYVFKLITPQNALVFAAVHLITTLAAHKLLRKPFFYIPPFTKTITFLAFATLLTLAAFEVAKVPLLLGTAGKILVCAWTFGLLGSFFAHGCSRQAENGRQVGEQEFYRSVNPQFKAQTDQYQVVAEGELP